MNLDLPFVDARALAKVIDHTLLKPEAAQDDIAVVCRQAVEHDFASVCVNPYWAGFVTKKLSGSKVKTCCVIGFPLGANATPVKVEEARQALADGALELDMVINIGALKSGENIGSEIARLAELAHASQAILKVILETCLLNQAQKVAAAKSAVAAGADFVKTSTGFSTGGATEEDVSLLRSTVGTNIGVKASGGVRSLDSVQRMVRAGATRIGTSSGVQIIQEFLGSVVDTKIGGAY